MKAKARYLLNLTLILSMTLVMVASPAMAGDSSGAGVQSASAAPDMQADSSAKIEAELVEAFSTGAEDYIVRFSEQADLSAAYRMDWNARGEYVYNTLRETAERSQKQAKQSLNAAGMSYQTFIAGNELYVWGGNLDSALTLAALPEVESIRQTRVYHIDPVMQEDMLVSEARQLNWVGDLLSYPYGPQRSAMSQASPQAIFDWGILDVQADQFWSTFGIQGEGILVANIDTGVQWDHPALVDQYKCGSDPTDAACWYDPSNVCGGSACDNNGHGTHTMGTMVADDDPDLLYTAGMAPDAQWIACKGCESSSCSDVALNACADWILAPGGDTGNRPHIVNNSWGGGGGDSWYLSKVDAWRAAGIFPAFSAGNAGPGCSTLGSPGDYQESFSTANHNSSRVISSTSSRGPSAFGHDPYTKPNISAPGSSICSTVPGSTWSCGYSGTSMASPHTAGAVALLWSCNPGLVGQIDQTFQILQDTTDIAPAGTCGAPPDGEGNYTYGYGFLNVYNSGTQWCGAAGSLQGIVTSEQTSDPVPDVHIYTDPGPFETTTDGSGFYDLTLLVGDYTIYAEAFGYLPDSALVTVVTDTITIQDFVLTPAATSPVTGVVYDSLTGWPLYARIDVAGAPGSPFWSDPQSGEYAIDLPTGGTYDFHVEAWVPGYLPQDASIAVPGPVSQDFPLDADQATCTAPGYEYGFAYSEGFEASNGGYSHSGTYDEWEWGTPTAWPGDCVEGSYCWGTDLDSNYENSANNSLISPVIDLSAHSAPLTARWWQAWQIESATWDHAYAEVSINGGPFQVMWEHTSGTVEVDWTEFSYNLSAAAGGTAQFRFRFTSDGSVTYSGYYIDRVAILGTCLPTPGGLVVGNVYDQNNLAALNGAEVSNDGGYAATSMATPDDPGVDDGFFSLFSPPAVGAINHYATRGDGYGVDLRAIPVLDGGTVAQDFYLPAGWLDGDPASLSTTLEFGQVETQQLTLSNLGSLDLEFEINERDQGLNPLAALQGLEHDFSPAVSIGPSSVRSAEAQKALGTAGINSWSGGAPLPAGNGLVRFGKAQCANDPNGFYLVSGVDEAYGVVDDFYHYDAASDAWTALAPIPTPQEGPSAVCYEDFIYVMGGGGTNQFYIYDIAANSWSAGPALPRNVWGAATGAYDGKVYLIGGDSDFSFGGTSDLVDIYDIASGTWSSGTPMPVAAVTSGHTQAGRYVYVVGGWNDGSPAVNVNATQRYDMSADSWATGSAFGAAKADFALAVTESRLYALGGDADGGGAFDVSSSVYALDHTAWPTGVWTDLGDPLSAALSTNTGGFCTSAMAGGEVWNTGGYTGSAILGVNEYRVSESCLSALGDVPWLSEDPITGTLSGSVVTPPLTASLGDELAVSEGPAQEVVGDEAPDGETAASALGLSSQPRILSAVLWDNGPLVTNPGGGFGGADLSALQTSLGLSTYGFGHQYIYGYRIADGFEVTAAEGWLVDNITFYAYQTGSSLISPMTGVYLQIWDGPPDDPGSSVVWGDLSTNRLVNSAWSGIYRALDTGPLDNARPIMANTVAVGVVLPQGGYWLDWTTSGVIASGPWAPPISVLGQTTTGDALQNTGTWAAAVDSGTGTQQGFPFVIEGSAYGPQSVVDVTFDAGVPEVDQPGDYHAILVVGNDTPYGPLDVPVTMTVLPPADWGKLEGTLTGLGYCDDDPAPLEGAQVVIEGSLATYTVTTDISGHYQWWLDEDNTPLNVTVSYPDHTQGTASELALTAGATTVQDFDLRWLVPCVSAAPTGFEVNVGAGYSLQQALTLTNAGAAASGFALSERPASTLASSSPVAPIADFSLEVQRLPDGSVDCGAYQNSIHAEPLVVAQACGGYQPQGEGEAVSRLHAPTDLGFAHDIGYVSDNVVEFVLNDFPGQTVLSASTMAIYGYDFSNDLSALYAISGSNEFGTLDRSTGVFTLVGYSTPLAGESWTGLTVDPNSGVLFASATTCAGSTLYTIDPVTANATPVGAMTGVGCAIDIAIGPGGAMYSHDIVADSIYQVDPATGAATLVGLTGYNANYAQGMDFDNSDGTLYIFLYQGSGANVYGTVDLTTGAVTPLAVDSPLGEFEGAVQVPGEPFDAPWLSEDPITGTLPADDVVEIELTFDTMTYTAGTQLMAVLRVESDDPLNDTHNLPVTMNVVAPAYGVVVSPDMGSSGHPAETITYTVYVTNTTNGPIDSFDLTLGSSDFPSTVSATTVGPLDPGEMAAVEVQVAIPPEAAGGTSDELVLTATSQGDQTKSDAVTLTTSVVGSHAASFDPVEYSLMGKPGETMTYTLMLTNEGDENTFTLTHAGNLWGVVMPTSGCHLGVGESMAITVMVTIDAGAANGDRDTVTITATGLGGALASAELTTVAALPKVYLPVIPQTYNAP